MYGIYFIEHIGSPAEDTCVYTIYVYVWCIYMYRYILGGTPDFLHIKLINGVDRSANTRREHSSWYCPPDVTDACGVFHHWHRPLGVCELCDDISDFALRDVVIWEYCESGRMCARDMCNGKVLIGCVDLRKFIAHLRNVHWFKEFIYLYDQLYES